MEIFTFVRQSDFKVGFPVVNKSVSKQFCSRIVRASILKKVHAKKVYIFAAHFCVGFIQLLVASLKAFFVSLNGVIFFHPKTAKLLNPKHPL